MVSRIETKVGIRVYIPGDEEAMFGKAYNRHVYRWIEENYEQAKDIPEAMRGIRVLLPKGRTAARL